MRARKQPLNLNKSLPKVDERMKRGFSFTPCIILGLFVGFLCVISSNKSLQEIENDALSIERKYEQKAKVTLDKSYSYLRRNDALSVSQETPLLKPTKIPSRVNNKNYNNVIKPRADLKPSPEVPVTEVLTYPPPPNNPIPIPNNNPNQNDYCPLGIVALTYATHQGKDDRFCRALESAIQHKVDLRVLGWGKPWTGLTQKLTGSLDFLRKLPESCVVVFTDAFDVLYADDLFGIKKKFDEQVNKNVLFAGECGCWPQITRDKGKGDVCLHDYPDNGSKYKYLNSGQWIANQKKALEIFEALIEEAPKYAERYQVEVKVSESERLRISLLFIH